MIYKRKPAPPANASPNGAIGGWEDAPAEVTRRTVIMNIYGETNTGRTSLALTAPGPIGLAHTQEKVDGIIQKFANKKIRLINFGGTFVGTHQQVLDAASAKWNPMVSAWMSANWARTLVMDTDTEGWEILRLARFGTPNPKGNRMDHLYGPVNAEWRAVFKCHREQRNVIIISQAKDEYVDKMKNGTLQSIRTGNTKRAGQKEIPFLSEVIVETLMDPMTQKRKAVIRKGWYNALSEGAEFTEDDGNMTFAAIMSFITETSEEGWA